ncbi:MAG: hypothetical protein K5637_07450 [Lachnospiraceae bacterium]|nr:hypothetical protein [Lachnospiraceae bacterium]
MNSNRMQKKDALVLLLFAAVSFASCFFRELANVDEMWNFTFGTCVAKGLLPYRDFNMLQTPFSAFVNGTLFMIFGQHVLVMRLAGAALFTGTAWNMYRSCRALGVNRQLSVVPPLGMFMFFYTNIFFEYSDFILFVMMLSIRKDIECLARCTSQDGREAACLPARADEPPLAIHALTGVICGLAILSKQTYGAFVAAGCWVCGYIILRSCGGSRKAALKAAVSRFLFSMIPCLIFAVFLFATGTFGDFWDMCVAGIGEFSSKYSYFSMMKENAGFFILGVSLPLCAVLGLIRSFRVKGPYGRMTLIVLVYSLAGLINMVPLANFFHVACSFIPFMIIAAAVVNDIALTRPEGRLPRIIDGAAWLACLAAAVYLLSINPADIINRLEFQTDIPCYEGIFMDSERASEIVAVDEFIESETSLGHEVYILDNQAAFFFNPLGMYHKYLDMFLNGNLGTKTAAECLEESLSEGAVYLLPDDTHSNYQYPSKAVKKYKTRLTEDGSVESFYVFRAAEN